MLMRLPGWLQRRVLLSLPSLEARLSLYLQGLPLVPWTHPTELCRRLLFVLVALI